MTGYTVHTGSSVKFSSGWDRVFESTPSGKKSTQATPGKAEKTAKSTKKSAAKKAASVTSNKKSAAASKKKSAAKSGKRVK